MGARLFDGFDEIQAPGRDDGTAGGRAPSIEPPAVHPSSQPHPDRWDIFADMMKAHPGCGAHERDDHVWEARGDSGQPVEAPTLRALSKALDES